MFVQTMTDGTENAMTQGTPFGRFFLHEKISQGAMAEIWLASDKEDNQFALRRLYNTSIFGLKTKKLFHRGCEILAKIHQHPNIIGYYEHGKIEGLPYVLLEYIEGHNLKLAPSRFPEVVEAYVGNILIDSALGLEHMHDAGYIHLDFKPENIMINRDGDVRLIDFDLAEEKPDKPRKMDKHSGTPAYMAPEQLQKLPLDHRADIFSFGITAYELLTNKKPFNGDTQDEVIRRHLDPNFHIASTRQHNPEIPVALDKIVLKCLERDPDKRYPYMSVLVRDLKTALYVD